MLLIFAFLIAAATVMLVDTTGHAAGLLRAARAGVLAMVIVMLAVAVVA